MLFSIVAEIQRHSHELYVETTSHKLDESNKIANTNDILDFVHVNVEKQILTRGKKRDSKLIKYNSISVFKRVRRTRKTKSSINQMLGINWIEYSTNFVQ